MKFQPADWHTNSFAISTNSERMQQASHDIRQEARFLRNETDVKTKWDQYDNTTRLADRIDAIRLWKEILEEDKAKLDKEIENLNNAKDETEKRLEALNIPTDSVNECLTLRDARTKIDNVEDEPEHQLLKEQELIAKSKLRLQQKIDESFEQLTLLTEARNQVLKDLQDKSVAMGIDIHQYNLNEESPNISFKPDSTRVLKKNVEIIKSMKRGRFIHVSLMTLQPPAGQCGDGQLTATARSHPSDDPRGR